MPNGIVSRLSVRSNFTLPLVVALLSVSLVAYADGSSKAVIGRWLSEHGDGVIEIYAAPDGTLEGKIVDGKEPERRDTNNPDPEKRSIKLFGTVIMRGMSPDGENHWSGGTIYDPDNGKTYRCKLTLASEDRLDLRGYVGISLLGRTSHWTRAKEQ